MNRLSGLILLIQFIHKMSQDKKVYNNIINSLFPTIYGNDRSREALLEFLKLFHLAGTSLRGEMSVSNKVTLSKDFLRLLTQRSVHQRQG